MALTLTVDHLYEDLHVQPNTDNAQRVARYLAGRVSPSSSSTPRLRLTTCKTGRLPC